MSLYQKYRPKNLTELVGQDAAVAQLSGMIAKGDVPHAILMSGPSGCGKTTTARILAAQLGIDPTQIIEKNCATKNGVDDIREIEDRLHIRPLNGKARMVILDECHMISQAGQRAMLKFTEDCPAHVYFVLCTTTKSKLERPLLTRLVNIEFYNVPDKELTKLVDRVATAEGIKKPETHLIVSAAGGSARQALVLLEQIASTQDIAAWHKILETQDEDDPIFAMVRALYAGQFTIVKYAKALKDMTDDEIERARALIMSYGCTMLLGGKGSAMGIMERFKDPFFYSKKPGFVLALAQCAADNQSRKQ